MCVEVEVFYAENSSSFIIQRFIGDSYKLSCMSLASKFFHINFPDTFFEKHVQLFCK